jgi:hypothetical protein
MNCIKIPVGLGGLVRAADFVGQLGDPDYFRKSPALFYEFEELGLNENLDTNRPMICAGITPVFIGSR